MTLGPALCLRPSPAAPGELLVTYADPPDDDRLQVDRADPKIWIANELMLEFLAGRHHGDVTFTLASPTVVTGWVLTIDAVNQRAVYVVRRYLFDVDCWEAEWPD